MRSPASGEPLNPPQALPRLSRPMDGGGIFPDLVGVPQRDAGTSEAAAKPLMLRVVLAAAPGQPPPPLLPESRANLILRVCSQSQQPAKQGSACAPLLWHRRGRLPPPAVSPGLTLVPRCSRVPGPQREHTELHMAEGRVGSTGAITPRLEVL